MAEDAHNLLILCDQHYDRSPIIKGRLLPLPRDENAIAFHTGCDALVRLEYENLTTKELPRFYFLKRTDRPERDPDAEAAASMKKPKNILPAEPHQAAAHLAGFQIGTALVFGAGEWITHVARMLEGITVIRSE